MTKSKKEDDATATISCVSSLMDAEKRARDLIEGSKKRKQANLKKARDDSTRVIEDFKKECEENLKRLEMTVKSNQGSSFTQMEKDAERNIQKLRDNYKNNSHVALQAVIELVALVKVEHHENFIINT